MISLPVTCPLLKPALSIGVSTAPGKIAFARILSGANSIAIARVNASIPPLLAAYAAMSAEVATAWTEETLTTAPAPEVLSRGWASLVPRKTDRKFEAITESHSSTEVSKRGLATWMAALFTSANSSPVYAFAWLKIDSIFSPSEISDWMNNPSPGNPSPKGALSTPITCHPLDEKVSTVALPMPPAAPVINTVRFVFGGHIDFPLLFE